MRYPRYHFVRSGGAPDVRCAWCRAKACSQRTIPGVASEYVCECCGFAWSGENGTDHKGLKYKRNARGAWERTYK